MTKDFNNILGIKTIDLPITLGVFMHIYTEDFNLMLKENTDEGSTYRFVVSRLGKSLTKNGVPFDSVLYTMPIYSDFVKLDDVVFTDKNSIESLLSFKEAQCNYDWELFSLENRLLQMVEESDFIKELFFEKGLVIDSGGGEEEWDKNRKILDEYSETLEVTFYKCNV